MLVKEFFRPEDEAYIISMRREIHRHPEEGFDLPVTVALVERELTKLGLTWTEQYGKGSVVCDLGSGKKLLALRADRDGSPPRTGRRRSRVLRIAVHFQRGSLRFHPHLPERRCQ